MSGFAQFLCPNPSSTCWLLAALACALFTLQRDPTFAQDPLLSGEPYDEIVLNAANNSAVLEVMTLDLPGRQVPETRPAGTMEVRLVSRPGQAYELAWSDVASIRLFEQVLLEKAIALTNGGQFDEAFDYFARLAADFPDLEGLEQQLQRYLQRNALKLYKESNFDQSMAVLTALYDRNPRFAGFQSALEAVSNAMIQARLKQQDFGAARAVLEMLESDFDSTGTAVAEKWRSRFRQAADRKIVEATKLTEQHKFVEAQRAARLAKTIWPRNSKTGQLLEHIQALHPQVTIGVFEQAPRDVLRTSDSWAALRTDRLRGRSISELEQYGQDGGVYQSSFGTFSTDVTGRQLTFRLADGMGSLAAPTLARFLLATADPTNVLYRSSFDALCDAVAVTSSHDVRIDLSRPHVRPEALLQLSKARAIWGEEERNFSLIYTQADRTKDSVRFEAEQSPRLARKVKLQAIVEETMPNEELALAALQGGDIAALDRVPPWLIARLQSVNGIRVEEYSLPTLHVLIPTARKPILQQQEFRRALCYGIARERILNQMITAGNEMLGFQVISGPLPPGKTLGDPLRYGYNNQIRPRPYEPRLSATLALVAATNVGKAERAKQGLKGPPAREQLRIPTLVLAHPTDPVATASCELIAQQLRQIGMPVELKPLGADALLAKDPAFDLRYAELAVWEPLIDVQVLFGEQSPFGPASPTMRAALRDLELAINWAEIRQQLNRIHEIANNELPVIPLWQTVNHFAHRRELTGIGASPISLYQNVAQWDLELAN